MYLGCSIGRRRGIRMNLGMPGNEQGPYRTTITIEDQVVRLNFDTHKDAQAATELLAAACYLGKIEFESKIVYDVIYEGTVHDRATVESLNTLDAVEFALENKPDIFSISEWCSEGGYLIEPGGDERSGA